MSSIAGDAETEPGASARAEIRRAQILDAAAACFREHGFHGASIARISRASGMSPGHIYHYFRNKEEIIEAIVEQDVARILDVHGRLRATTDPEATTMVCVAEAVRNMLDPDMAALKLEILAEAARNARIAELVRAADRRTRASLIETLCALGKQRSAEDLDDCADSLCAMFDGLMTRGVRNPDLDADTVTRRYQRMVKSLLQL